MLKNPVLDFLLFAAVVVVLGYAWAALRYSVSQQVQQAFQ